MDSEQPENPDATETEDAAAAVSEGAAAADAAPESSGRFAKLAAIARPALRADHTKFVVGVVIGSLATFSVTAVTADGKVEAPVAAQLAQLRADVKELQGATHTTTAAAEHGNEHPTDNGHGETPTTGEHGATETTEPPHWTYGEAKDWGALSDAYIACAEGTEQSPIALETEGTKRYAGEMEFEYEPHAITVVDNGHTVQVDAEGGGHLIDGEHEYSLVQFHVHLPSEHTIDTVQYPLEIHFVHKDEHDKLAVVGVMVEEGKPVGDFEGILHAIGEVGVEGEVEEPFDVDSLLPERHDVLRYTGSLTTPPCTEGVSWNVMVEPITMSKAQIAALKAHLHEPNNRPLQDANGRSPRLDVDLSH